MTNKERFNNQEMQKIIPEINMKRKYLQQIISGEKTTEGRINSGPFKNVQEGDKIKFFNDGGRYISALCEIRGVQKYPGFQEMLEGEGYQTMIPDAVSLREAVSVYNGIPTYPERAREKGVVALRLKVIR
ncbi:MAG TPA: ASCH domain-containing protein [Candidatus Woesebacteria bacterium]|mgnify:CR=1 FL=1|nr:ASCH domain-containing protein [Candidatus Woesebacteria bacterium]